LDQIFNQVFFNKSGLCLTRLPEN